MADSPETICPQGYQEIKLLTKAEVHLYNKDINDIIDTILKTQLKKKDNDENAKKPISLFFVDPCGVVSWNDVIYKICRRANKKQGTDMILNWSWEAIARTLNTESKNKVLSDMYGIPLEQIAEEFKDIETMNQYLEKYIKKLQKYFKHVEIQGVPKDRKFKPKLSNFRKYFLLLCTNNPSAYSIAGHKKRDINKNLKEGFEDITNDWI